MTNYKDLDLNDLTEKATTEFSIVTCKLNAGGEIKVNCKKDDQWLHIGLEPGKIHLVKIPDKIK